MIGTSLIIIIALVALIWALSEFQKIKHKLWAVILIGLLLFAYLSFVIVLKDKDIDYKSPTGLIQASKVYFSWLGSVLGNFRVITSHAINLDWQPPEETSVKEEK